MSNGITTASTRSAETRTVRESCLRDDGRDVDMDISHFLLYVLITCDSHC